MAHDKSSVASDFQKGEEVGARNHSTQGPQWLARHISNFTGPVSVEI